MPLPDSLRAILPIGLTTEDIDYLEPFYARIRSVAEKTAVVFYRWKTQAIRAVEE